MRKNRVDQIGSEIIIAVAVVVVAAIVIVMLVVTGDDNDNQTASPAQPEEQAGAGPPGDTPSDPADQGTSLVGRANSQTALADYEPDGRILGKITDKNNDDVRLTEAYFELVDGMYVHASTVIHNSRPESVDISCLYGAYTAHSGASLIYNLVASSGDNEFSVPLGTTIYSPGPDVFDEYNFQVECSIGHHPHGIGPRD